MDVAASVAEDAQQKHELSSDHQKPESRKMVSRRTRAIHRFTPVRKLAFNMTSPSVNSPESPPPVQSIFETPKPVSRLFSDGFDMSPTQDGCFSPNRSITDLLPQWKDIETVPGTNLISRFSSLMSAPISTPSQQTSSSENAADPLIELVSTSKDHPCNSIFRRCQSDNTAVSTHSNLYTECDNSNLIGDKSTSYCLPTIPGNHSDLKSITAETLVSVLRGEFADIDSCILLDCRYPYEYDGGHIEEAENICRKDECERRLFDNPPQNFDSNKCQIIVLHCEFSSERAPKMSRFIRNHDRTVNSESYPHLHYPEMYLLHGGYKEFFSTYKALCQPQAYKPMLDKSHAEDLTQMRRMKVKAKTWPGETNSKGRVRTGLRF